MAADDHIRGAQRRAGKGQTLGSVCRAVDEEISLAILPVIGEGDVLPLGTADGGGSGGLGVVAGHIGLILGIGIQDQDGAAGAAADGARLNQVDIAAGRGAGLIPQGNGEAGLGCIDDIRQLQTSAAELHGLAHMVGVGHGRIAAERSSGGRIGAYLVGNAGAVHGLKIIMSQQTAGDVHTFIGTDEGGVADDHGDRKQKTDARPKPFFHSSFSFLFFCALHEYPFGSHC